MLPHPNASDSLRVEEARARSEPLLRSVFAEAGLAYPPTELHLRAYKLERRLEVWARSGEKDVPFVRVATFPILGLSGVPGPKRREGDLQVPEGFYQINRFNPRSRFYLSLGLDYPNASDRQLTPCSGQPGSDIFIHGGEQSRGCLAMGDDAMSWLYLAALDTVGSSARPILVYLFPCCLDTPDWKETLRPFYRHDPGLLRFWENLSTGDRLFVETRRLLHPRVGPEGFCFSPLK